MTERTVPKEFNDANIAAARRFKAERDALLAVLPRLIELAGRNEADPIIDRARALVGQTLGNRND